MIRTEEEFQKKIKELGIIRWNVDKCSNCKYLKAFVFYPNGAVIYDAGCDCCPVGSCFDLRKSSWDEAFEEYNEPRNPDVIKMTNKFWRL